MSDMLAAADWPPTTEQIGLWLDGFDTTECALSHPRPHAVTVGRRVAGSLRTVAFILALDAFGILVIADLLVVLLLLLARDFALAVTGLAVAVFTTGAGYRLLRDKVAPWWSAGAAAPPAANPANDMVSVTADTVGLRVNSPHGASDERWLDLVSIEPHGSSMVLSFDLGEAIRLPNDEALEPVFRVAYRVVAARQAREEALQARMERGLSRPESDERAERGLSVTQP